MVPIDTNRDTLVIENLALADQIARGVARRLPASFDAADLAATGYVALIAAAEAYRPKEHGGVPFAAFARQRVRGAILDSVRRRNWTAATCAPLDDVKEPATPATAHEQIERDERMALVSAAIGKLPAFRQRILKAYYREGEREPGRIAEQVAREMGVSSSLIYREMAAAIAELRIRCRGASPAARRLVSVATPKLPAVKKPHAAALAAKVKPLADEIGDIEKMLAPYELQIARLPLLRKALRECYDDAPAAGTYEAAGERFIVMVGARGKQSVINIPKLVKAIGAKAFTLFATVTLKDLEAHTSCSVRADVVTVTQTGPRSLVTVERGTPELPKAA